MATVGVNINTDTYVQVNSNFNGVTLQVHRDAVRIVFSDTQPARSNSVFHILREQNEPLVLPFIDTNVWALATTDTSSLVSTSANDLRQPVLSAFGESSTIEPTPEVQLKSQYGVSHSTRVIEALGGSAGFEDRQFVASSGVNPDGVGAIFSKRQVISRSGQGVVARFTARFPAGVVGCRQVAGLATALDSMTFGYSDDVFGVTYSHSGRVVIEELTITTAVTGAENATVTINGTPYTVALTAGTVQHNAYEVVVSLQSQVPGYIFAQNGDTVTCRSLFAAPESGAFSFSSATAVAAWVQLANGQLPTREFTAQVDWDNPKPDLIPSNLNHYSIRYNGSIKFYIQDDNTGEDVLVHEVNNTNNSTVPMFSISTFRVAWVVTNTGNTTDVSLYGTSGAAFIEGNVIETDEAHSENNTVTGVGSSLVNILTIKCREVFGVSVNLGRMIPKVITVATDSNKGAVVEIHNNATFAGDTDYSYHDKQVSIAEVDTTPNIISAGDNVVSVVLGPLGSRSLDLKELSEIIVPGDTLSVGMRVSSGGGTADMTCSLIWADDL